MIIPLTLYRHRRTSQDYIMPFRKTLTDPLPRRSLAPVKANTLGSIDPLHVISAVASPDRVELVVV